MGGSPSSRAMARESSGEEVSVAIVYALPYPRPYRRGMKVMLRCKDAANTLSMSFSRANGKKVRLRAVLILVVRLEHN